MGAFSIVNKTARPLKTNGRVIPFKKIKDDVLDAKYELSLAFVGKAESTRVTKKYKYGLNPDAKGYGVPTTKGASGNKDKASNVLSFPLSKNSGEIIICPHVAGDYTLAYLFIHGLVHLKGHEHSDTMDRIEHRLLKKYGFERHEQTNRRN